MRNYNEVPLWKDVTPEQWNDWRWQVRNRIDTIEDLKQVINLSEDEEAGIKESLKILRMGITPYYANLMDPNDPNCPFGSRRFPLFWKPIRLRRIWTIPSMKMRILPFPG